MRVQPGAQYLSRALILCNPCEVSQIQLEELPYCWNQALTSTRTALFTQKTFSCECVCGQTDSEIGIKARSVSWSHSRSLVLSTLLFYSTAPQHKMHKSLLPPVFPSRSQSVLLFSFCLWPGTLCCRTAELSRLLSPFQNSLVVMALIWEGVVMSLHPLSSDKTSGPILHPLIPGLLCRQWTEPPTNAWIKSVLPKWVQYDTLHERAIWDLDV